MISESPCRVLQPLRIDTAWGKREGDLHFIELKANEIIEQCEEITGIILIAFEDC